MRALPELPEAETIRRGLEEVAIGLKIVNVEVPVSQVLRMPPEAFAARVTGATISKIGRRAKMVLIFLSTGETLLFHLMMSGSLLYMPADAPGREKAQVIFVLDNGHEIRYRDPRKFGYVKVLETDDISKAPELSHIGIEPLSDEFTLETFKSMLRKHPRVKVKALLLNQSFVAGIGNIYADEVLFYARVHPSRLAGTLSDEEIERLHEGIRKILAKSIELKGSTIATYSGALGERGTFPDLFKVYGRTGEPCEGCGGTVSKIKVAGRGTHICLSCQKP